MYEFECMVFVLGSGVEGFFLVLLGFWGGAKGEVWGKKLRQGYGEVKLYKCGFFLPSPLPPSQNACPKNGPYLMRIFCLAFWPNAFIM